MQIHDKEFKRRGRNGYDSYEVDEFLDAIIDDYGDCLDEVVDLKNENLSLKKELDQKDQELAELKQNSDTVAAQPKSASEFDQSQLLRLKEEILEILNKEHNRIDTQLKAVITKALEPANDNSVDKQGIDAVKFSAEDGKKADGVSNNGIRIDLPPKK